MRQRDYDGAEAVGRCLVIEPTDEMEQAMVYGGPIRERLAALLAIVQRETDDRYGRLLAANRKLVAQLELLERIEDERDRALGELEDVKRTLAKMRTEANFSAANCG